MAGNTCSFAMRTPPSWELENCLHLEIMFDAEWNLSAPHFEQDSGDHSQDFFEARVLAYDTRHRWPDVLPKELPRQWNIGIDMATKTLKATTQAGIWHAVHLLNCRYRTDNMTLWHRQLHMPFCSDTLFSSVTLLHRNKCAQVHHKWKVSACLFNDFKVQSWQCPLKVCRRYWNSRSHSGDGAKEQVGKNTEFNWTCKYYKIQQCQMEPYIPRQNWAEAAIGKMKKQWQNKMHSRGIVNVYRSF